MEMFERLRLLKAVMLRNDYPRRTSCTGAMLNLMEDAPIEERITLMTFLITSFSLISREHGLPDAPTTDGVATDERFAAIRDKIGSAQMRFVASLLHANDAPEETARKVLRYLDELDGNDERMVALVFLLESPLVPYAELPPDFLKDTVVLEQETKKPSVIRSKALAWRILHETGSTPTVATGLHRVLRLHTDPHEAEAVLAYMIALAQQLAVQKAMRELDGLTVGIQVPPELKEILAKLREHDPFADPEDRRGGKHYTN